MSRHPEGKMLKRPFREAGERKRTESQYKPNLRGIPEISIFTVAVKGHYRRNCPNQIKDLKIFQEIGTTRRIVKSSALFLGGQIPSRTCDNFKSRSPRRKIRICDRNNLLVKVIV